jgi:hypothetical protein
MQKEKKYVVRESRLPPFRVDQQAYSFVEKGAKKG